MVEYQDAEAFAARASVHFRVIEDQLPEHEAGEAKGLLGDLRSGMMAAEDPEAMRLLVDGIIQEMREAAGLAEG
jgi:hypothetical protein